MAHSPKGNKARLIREITRDFKESPRLPPHPDGPDSPANIDNTWSTDFDPEHEAIVSSNLFDGDTTQRLPNLRDSAKKYKRFSRLTDPAAIINTSALRNAFPDFTQPGPSDSSVSIELGRGLKNRNGKKTGQTDKSEDSIRPPTLNMTARSTRFGSNQGPIATTATSNSSFIAPKLPNLSELVSGIYEDGTSVFSLKPRSSRYAEMEEIPLPQDEEAIIMSLNILQARIIELEKKRAKSEATIGELTSKNELLQCERAESRRWRRSDSALGSTDGSDAGDDAARGSRRWMIEKTRLENALQKLQEQFNAETRKLAISEVAVKTLTQERDAAVTQLGVAFLTTEQLKFEKQSLSDQNLQLHAEIAQLKVGQEAQTKKWQRLEENLREKILRREKMIHSLQEATRTTMNTSIVQEQSDGHLLDSIKHPQASKQGSKPTSTPLVQSFPERKEPTRVQVGDDSGDITYLSVNDDGEVAELRRVLEQERIARKQKKAVNYSPQAQDDDTRVLFDMTAPSTSKPSVATETINKANATAHSEPSTPIRASDSHQRHHSEDSLLQHRNQRSGLIDMTSAFILPDITMRNPESNIEDISPLSTIPPKKTVKVAKPIPVSDRMPAIALYEDEPTIRPSQPPAKALAIVMKGLDNEMERLKRQHSHLQTIYNQHDPALSKRRRKSVYQRMQNIMKDIDIKADQIYALHDVLEGQKAAGQTMTEDEFEMTLQSIGIDPNDMDLTGHEMSAQSDSDSEMPWNGIA